MADPSPSSSHSFQHHSRSHSRSSSISTSTTAPFFRSNDNNKKTSRSPPLPTIPSPGPMGGTFPMTSPGAIGGSGKSGGGFARIGMGRGKGRGRWSLLAVLGVLVILVWYNRPGGGSGIRDWSAGRVDVGAANQTATGASSGSSFEGIDESKYFGSTDGGKGWKSWRPSLNWDGWKEYAGDTIEKFGSWRHHQPSNEDEDEDTSTLDATDLTGSSTMPVDFDIPTNKPKGYTKEFGKPSATASFSNVKDTSSTASSRLDNLDIEEASFQNEDSEIPTDEIVSGDVAEPVPDSDVDVVTPKVSSSQNAAGDSSWPYWIPTTCGEGLEDLVGEEQEQEIEEVRRIVEGRHKAEFWTVTAQPVNAQPKRFIISPSRPVSPVHHACLSQTIFTARLVGPFNRKLGPPPFEVPPTGFFYLLERPTPANLSDVLTGPEWKTGKLQDENGGGLKTSTQTGKLPTGAYIIEMPDSALPLPGGKYELEITIDFGWFPDVVTGQPCEGQVCDVEVLAKELNMTGVPESLDSQEVGFSMDYSGERFALSKPVSIANLVDAPGFNEDLLPLCPFTFPLSGYWNKQRFHPFSAFPPHSRCRFFEPHSRDFLPPALIESRRKLAPENRPLIWLQFVGDSNLRNLNTKVLSLLGSGFKAIGIGEEGEKAGKSISALAFRGSKAPKETYVYPMSHRADVVVTWEWWRMDAEPDIWPQNVQHLSTILDGNLLDFVDRTHISKDKEFQRQEGATKLEKAKVAKIRPSRTFLSLGSHAANISVSGTEEYLDLLFSTALTPERIDESNVRMVTTSTVNPAAIPLDRFPHDDLMRNSAIIKSRNSLLRERPELQHGRAGGTSLLIDPERLTESITHPLMKDAVHFKPPGYEEWAKLIWTEWISESSAKELESSRKELFEAVS